MESTCIKHPERESLVIIKKTQIKLCENNQCAAVITSYAENCQIHNRHDALKIIVNYLIDRGMKLEKLQYPDTAETLNSLISTGATLDVFSEAYDLSGKESINRFGINYLAKVVTGILTGKNLKKENAIKKCAHEDYESDYKNGLDCSKDN